MNPRPLLCTAFAFAFALSTVATATSQPAQRRGVITYDFDLSGQTSGEETRLWVPYPVSSPHQLVTDVKVDGDFAESGVYTDPEFGNAMLYARWAPGARTRKLSFSFRVNRKERLDRDLPTREAPWDPADYAEWLRPTRLGPLDGPVGELADKITAGKTTVLAKARAVYDWTSENTYRDPATRGCGPGDVCSLLEDPGGKCGDISSVFVALARAAGVPARDVLGIRQGKKNGQNITGWQHCWAEFYLPGHGWVPVDPADVRKMMLKRGLGRTDPVPEDLRAYYWGGIDAYRVRLGVDRDLTLTPPQEGEPVNYLMYPFAQVGGRTLDWLDPDGFRYTITYEEI